MPKSAPRNLRATLAIIAVGLVPLGGALAGFAAAALVPQYGWQILFEIGGIVPVVFALAAIVTLPESIKFMTLHDSHRGKMEALLAAIAPDYKVPPNARFVIEDEKQSPSSPIYLFGNGLAAITPLTWLMFACNLMGYFFLISWTPTLMGAAHVPPQTAALAGAALQVGGTVGALVLCWWLQKARFLAIAILFVIAVPVVGSIGFAGLSSTGALIAATFFAGAIVLGIQSGINVVGAMIYPTSLRANGSGWQLGIGRLGAIIGPLLGALFVGLPVPQLYMWSAMPFAVGAVVCFIIYKLNTARLKARPELAQGRPVIPGAKLGRNHRQHDRGYGSDLPLRGNPECERLKPAQRRDHLLAEQPDRAQQRVLRQVGEVELAHEDVEHAFFGGGADFGGDRFGRADEDEIVLEQIIGVEQMLHDLRGAGLAAADEHFGVLAGAVFERLAGFCRREKSFVGAAGAE